MRYTNLRSLFQRVNHESPLDTLPFSRPSSHARKKSFQRFLSFFNWQTHQLSLLWIPAGVQLYFGSMTTPDSLVNKMLNFFPAQWLKPRRCLNSWSHPIPCLKSHLFVALKYQQESVLSLLTIDSPVLRLHNEKKSRISQCFNITWQLALSALQIPGQSCFNTS